MSSQMTGPGAAICGGVYLISLGNVVGGICLIICGIVLSLIWAGR